MQKNFMRLLIAPGQKITEKMSSSFKVILWMTSQILNIDSLQNFFKVA